jgi:hypothetical protein
VRGACACVLVVAFASCVPSAFAVVHASFRCPVTTAEASRAAHASMRDMAITPSPNGVGECAFQGHGLEISVVGSTPAEVAASRSEGLPPIAAAQGIRQLTTGFAGKGFAVYHPGCRSNPAATTSFQFLFDSSGGRAWQISVDAACALKPSEKSVTDIMARLLGIATLRLVAAPSQAPPRAFKCPVSASQITSAAGRPMVRMTGLPDQRSCTFVNTEPGVSDSGTSALNNHSLRINVGGSTRAVVTYARQSLKPLNPRMKTFRTGFATGGAAIYTNSTSLNGTRQLVSVLIVYFDGTHGAAWQLEMLANVKLKIPQRTFTAIMSRLRALPSW